MTCKTPEAIERSLARARAWKANNKDRVRASRKAYYETHKAEERRAQREWLSRNPEAAARHAKAHAAYIREWQATRKSERTGLVAMFKPSRVRSDYGHVCWACGSDRSLGMDHIIPLKAGGSNFAFNVRLLCASCNGRKRTRLDHEVADQELRARLLLGHDGFVACFGGKES